MVRRVIVCFCLLATPTIVVSKCHSGERTRGRREFVQALNHVKAGMTEAEVLALLGKPDDIQSLTDRTRGSVPGNFEAWRFGSSGASSPATLGRVYFDHQHRVSGFTGRGTPPPDGLFTESELRNILTAIDQVPGYDSDYRFNPRPLIRAVNLLQPLGKEKALAAIDEDLRIGRMETVNGLYLLLRALFDVPEKPGYMPGIIGPPNPSWTKDPKLLPRFPLAIEDDLPFLLGDDGSYTGGAPNPWEHVAYFRKYAKLRSKPLVPSDKPFVALGRLVKIFKQNGMSEADCERIRAMLSEQLLRLIDTVYRVESDEAGGFLTWDKSEKNNTILGGALNLTLRWDGSRQRFTRLDGTFLPDLDRDRYRRLVWKPALPNMDPVFIVQRQSRRFVSVRFEENYNFLINEPCPRAVLRGFNPKATNTPLFEFKTCNSGFGITDATIRLDEGDEIQMELEYKNERQRAPVLKP
jgi:hypothetical protein